MDRYTVKCAKRTSIRMELPQLGQQCNHTSCLQLDFLPLQCKCGKIFCSQHYNQHAISCEVQDNQASDLRKIQDVSKCSHPDCSATGVILIECEKCLQTYCVKHRHTVECKPKDAKEVEKEKERYRAPVRQFTEAKLAVDKQVNKTNLIYATNKTLDFHKKFNCIFMLILFVVGK